MFLLKKKKKNLKCNKFWMIEEKIRIQTKHSCYSHSGRPSKVEQTMRRMIKKKSKSLWKRHWPRTKIQMSASEIINSGCTYPLTVTAAAAVSKDGFQNNAVRKRLRNSWNFSFYCEEEGTNGIFFLLFLLHSGRVYK